jgi:CheY-like chemotaxis protein
MDPMKTALLLVDDEPINLDIVSSYVRHTGRECVTASSGAEALTLAASQRFAMILMDIRMPGMTGFEATRVIRATPGPNQHALMLAFTANSSPEKHEACLAAGLDGVVVKPLSYDTMAAIIDTWSLGAHEPDA